MSERHTSARARDIPGSAIGEWGRVDRATMIKLFRAHHQRLLKTSQEALAVPDDELLVETYLGSIAQRKREEVTS